MRGLFAFPNPVNEKAARVVAGVVALAAAVALGTGWQWLLVPIAYGFWARVLTGPKLSPLGWLAQKVIAPRLGAPRLVSGPPKRFAQGMGAGMSTLALVLGPILGWDLGADILLALLVAAAGLESLAGYCLGCRAFAALMALGLAPTEVCAECADISLRRAPVS